MMSALKIDQIYEKIYLVENIVEKCTNCDHPSHENQTKLSLDQLKEFALNLGALQMVNFLPHMDLIPV